MDLPPRGRGRISVERMPSVPGGLAATPGGLVTTPGGLSNTNFWPREFDTLSAVIQAVNPDTYENSLELQKRFEIDLKTCCHTEELLKAFVTLFHERALDDPLIGTKFATACAFVSNYEVNGVKLRTLVLSAVQQDFESRSHLQSSNNTKFLNSVAFLGEIYHRFRLPGGAPISILSCAMLVYLDILLDGDEHEMELFTKELCLNGLKIQTCSPKDLTDLLLHVRTTIMSRNLSGKCRTWLLLALDVASNNFGSMSPELQDFYRIHLGSVTLSELRTDDAKSADILYKVLSKASSKEKLSTVVPAISSPPDTLSLSSHTPNPQTPLSPQDINSFKFTRPSPTTNSSQLSPSANTFETPITNRDLDHSVTVHVNLNNANRRVEKARVAGLEGGTTSKPAVQQEGNALSWRIRNAPEKRWEEGTSRDVDREAWGLSSGSGSSQRRANMSEHDDRFEKDYEQQEPRESGRPRRKLLTEVWGNWRERKSEENLVGSNSFKSNNQSEGTRIRDTLSRSLSNPPAQNDDNEWE